MNLLQGLGQAQPVTGFIDTALKFQTTQAELETRRMQQQALQQQQAQMEKDNKRYHPDAVLALYPEKHRPGIKKMWTIGGLIDPDNTIGGKDIRSTPELFKKYPDIALSTNLIEIEELEKKAKSDKITPEEKLQIADELTDLHKKNAFIRGKEPAKPNVYKPDDFVQQPDGSFIQMPSKETEQWSEPFSGKVGGKEILLRKSLKTGKVEQVSAGPAGTTVTVGVDMGLSKGARAKAEEEVQEGTDLYTGLQKLLEISRPEYFTYAGQIQAKAEKIGEKAGVVKDPAMLRGYSAWKVGVEQEFNKYRKWVTGVAAGPVELEMIRQTFPNKDMSETEFKAAARQTAITTWKLVERRRRALNAGINDPGKQKEFYRLLPLDAMPDPPPEVIQRFSPKSKFEIIEVR